MTKPSLTKASSIARVFSRGTSVDCATYSAEIKVGGKVYKYTNIVKQSSSESMENRRR